MYARYAFIVNKRLCLFYAAVQYYNNITFKQYFNRDEFNRDAHVSLGVPRAMNFGGDVMKEGRVRTVHFGSPNLSNYDIMAF